MRPSNYQIWRLIFLVYVLPSVSMATTWVMLRGPDKEVQHAYDRDRLRIDGQNVTFWRRIKFRKPQSSEFGEVSRAIYQERIDCQNQMLQTLFVGLYDERRHPLLERGMSEVNQSTVILPESIGELFQTAVCRYAVSVPSSTTAGKTPATGKTPASAFVPQRRPVVVDNPAAPSFPPVGTPAVPTNPNTPVVPAPVPPTEPNSTTPIVPPLLPLTAP